MASLMTIMGAMALMGGSMTYFTLPMGVEFGIKLFINLKESGMLYPLYVNPPFASASSYRVYAIKNPREVLSGKKMKLNIKGPFLYSARLERDNMIFLKSGDVLHYDTTRKLVLDEKNSAPLDEKFWMLNPIVPVVSHTVQKMIIDRVPFSRITEPVVFNTVNVLLDTFDERLIARTSARSILEGRKVELLESVINLADRFGLRSLIPPGPPDSIFGVAYIQNVTTETMEIWTGTKTPEKFADVYKWRGKTSMDVWKGKCNEIKGTNGELYKPFVQKDKEITIFLAQLCRSITLDPVSDEVELPNGLRGLEFEISPRNLMGARNNPKNKCFCTDTRTYDCQYDGFISMGPCFFGSPIYFSRANFKGVDRRIRSMLEEDTIYSPDVSEKQSFWLEPTTGSVLAVDLTFVANAKMVRQPYMRDMARIQNLTYAPMFLVNESIVVPSGILWQVKALQMMLDYYKPATIGAAIGGFCLLVSGCLFSSKAKTSEKAVAPAATIAHTTTQSQQGGEIQ